jgi:CysZ protein
VPMSSDCKLEKMGSFADGFGSVFAGVKRVFSTRGLKRYVIIPFILNLIILSGLWYLSLAYIYPKLASFVPTGGGFLLGLLFSLLGVLLKIVFLILTFLLLVLLYSIIGMAVCAPFIEPISEKVEEVVTGRKIDTPFSISGMFRDISRSVMSSLGMLIIFIGFNVLLFFINLIPFIGTIIYVPLSIMSFLFFTGYQLNDSIFARKSFTLSKKLGTSLKMKWAVMGVGAGFAVMALIPVFGFLAAVFGSAGATEIYFRWPSRPEK